MNILYIDDDAEDRELFKEALYEVDPAIVCYLADDGAKGLNTLEELVMVPDLIFVDVNMPIMNGKQFLKTVKNTIRLRTIPVIMYSTTSQPREMNEYFQLGARDFLVKPSSFSDVCETLKKAIEITNSHSTRTVNDLELKD
jgi:CheY-like chemotaxis protein